MGRIRAVYLYGKRIVHTRVRFMPAKKTSSIRLTHKVRFQQRLLGWYAEFGRAHLPWRHTDNPYHILVSEMMLQQTQVERVMPKYAEWLDKYPSLEDLAGAEIEEVKATWKGLGYNIRPQRLHDIARETVASYGGELPRDAAELRKFTGIGRYTAGAVASFAYRHDEAILDTNVRRVLQRVFVGKRVVTDRVLWQISERVLPCGQAYAFNSALMDFGALLCTARAPLCHTCPMADFCRHLKNLSRKSHGGSTR